MRWANLKPATTEGRLREVCISCQKLNSPNNRRLQCRGLPEKKKPLPFDWGVQEQTKPSVTILRKQSEATRLGFETGSQTEETVELTGSETGSSLKWPRTCRCVAIAAVMEASRSQAARGSVTSRQKHPQMRKIRPSNAWHVKVGNTWRVVASLPRI